MFALEHPTNPSDLVEADENAAEDHESLVDADAPLMAETKRRKRLSCAGVRSTAQQCQPVPRAIVVERLRPWSIAAAMVFSGA